MCEALNEPTWQSLEELKGSWKDNSSLLQFGSYFWNVSIVLKGNNNIALIGIIVKGNPAGQETK